MNTEYIIDGISIEKPENNGKYEQIDIRCTGVEEYNWDNNNWTVQYNRESVTDKTINCTVSFKKIALLADEIELGDYVYYRPNVTNYSISTSMTGYTSTQAINPSELTSWRVIRKNDNGTIELISTSTSSKLIYFNGSIGIMNNVGTLQSIARQYETSGITSGSRYMGYNGQTLNLKRLSTSNNNEEYTGGGDSLYSTDISLVNAINALSTGNKYWVAGRSFYYQSGSHVSYYAVCVNGSTMCDGSSSRLYSADINGSGYKYDYVQSAYLRPIVTLKSGIIVNQGNGEKSNPWRVN